jgi:hypothetical protein
MGVQVGCLFWTVFAACLLMNSAETWHADNLQARTLWDVLQAKLHTQHV